MVAPYINSVLSSIIIDDIYIIFDRENKMKATTKTLTKLKADKDGYIKANEIAEFFSAHAVSWWTRTKTTRQLADYYKKFYNIEAIKRERGRSGGTWLHPDFAIKFLSDLSPEFAARIMYNTALNSNFEDLMSKDGIEVSKAS
jgi:hypothetical protein